MFTQTSVAGLQTELTKLSKIMGAAHVRTTFMGDGAYTDGNIINVPHMDVTAELDPEDQAAMRGYHIHETSHVTDTDMTILQRRTVKGKPIKRIWNASEDVYVERKAIEKYEGAKRSIQATTEKVLAKENKFWKENPLRQAARITRWWDEIPYAALQQGRKNMGYDSEALDEYLQGLPKQLRREARKYAKRMVAAENSEQALRVARAMQKRMKKYGDEYDTPEEPPCDGDDGEQPNDGDTQQTEQETNEGIEGENDDIEDEEGNTDGEGDDEGDDEGTGDTDEGDDDDDDLDDDTDGDDGDGDGDFPDDGDIDGDLGCDDDDDGDGTQGTGDDQEEDTPRDDTQDDGTQEAKGFDLEEAEKRADEAMNDTFGKYNSGDLEVKSEFSNVFYHHNEYWAWQKVVAEEIILPMSKDMNRTDEARSIARQIHRQINDWCRSMEIDRTEVLHEIQKNTKRHMPSDLNAYSARLARMLLSQEERRNEGGFSSGRIDRRRLASVAAGNENVFARPQIMKTSETRILIAIDGSSSMNDRSTRIAVDAVNTCLGRANVRFDIAEWGGMDWSHVIDGLDAGANFTVHKKANEHWRKIDKAFDFCPQSSDTPSHTGMLTCAKYMSAWTEPRKILLFLTDGMPNGYNHGECEMIKQLTVVMEQNGMEVYGVGIDVDFPMENSFNKYVECNFDSLGATMLGGLEKLLIEKGHAHGS